MTPFFLVKLLFFDGRNYYKWHCRVAEISVDIILIHYSEIGLKKGNRKYFEQMLIQNILTALNDLSIRYLKQDYGRFVLYLDDKSDVEAILSRLINVMGIAYFCPAYEGSSDVELLKEEIFEKIEKLEFSTFRVHSRRADKQFPLTSIKINQIVGEKIHKHLDKAVDLSNPDFTCSLEIYNKPVFDYFIKV